jgi:hypothetical protein
VHVIGHQYVGVHTAFEALGQLFEVVQVKPVVFLGEKAGDTVVSPLNDVQGDARKPQTRASWHFGISPDYASSDV